MKPIYPTLWLALFSVVLAIHPACRKPEECERVFSVTQTFPADNPVNGPVLIRGAGFTNATEVYFANVNAPVDLVTDSFLTVRVPRGLIGLVEVSVEDENCLDRIDFDVTSAYPSNLPTSPPSIILPTQGITFPLNFSVNASIQLTNVYDTAHVLTFSTFVGDNVERIGNHEFKERSGHMQVDYDDDSREVYLALDRSGSPYASDTLQGRFTTLQNFEKPDGTTVTNNFLWLMSLVTGRQYLFEAE